MIKTLEKSARNENEAIQLGLDELGLDRDDVSVEIIQRSKSGFLGIGSCPAIVKLSYEVEDMPEVKSAPVKPVRNEQEKKPAEKKQEKKNAERKQSQEQKAQPKAEPPVKAAAPVDEDAEYAEVRGFLSGLFEHMGVKADMEFSRREGGGINVKLSGNGMGAIIGRRGETLDAIQHLTNYAVNHGSDKRMHINVDAEDYRSKREDSLVKLAEKMAEKAIKYKRSMALEPMNSYERHVIHTALQDYEGVTTASSGEEPNRRVVVTPVKAEGTKAEKSSVKAVQQEKKEAVKSESAPGPDYKAPAANKPQSREWA